jgi:hypothetical protein
MAWDRGYYYRVRRVNGRVVREYVGSGKLAELIAKLDEAERAERRLADEKQCAQIAEIDALDAEVARLEAIADLLAKAALVSAGYHQHKRGEWRKRRGENDKTV